MTDLFTWADHRDQRACGSCTHLDPKPIDSGCRYCWKHFIWCRPEEVRACTAYAVPA